MKATIKATGEIVEIKDLLAGAENP